jgi:hypothetical protein
MVMGLRAIIDLTQEDDFALDQLLDQREPIYGLPALGIEATLNGRGFRSSDGSLQWGSMIARPELHAERRAFDIEQLAERTDMFITGNEVNQPMLEALDDFLADADALNITVIGFAPPFTPSIYAGQIASGEHEYLPKSQPMIADIFASYDFPYFDWSDATVLDLEEEDFFDSWHTTELGSLVIYQQLLRELPDLLGPYSDLDHLEGVAAAALDSMRVYDHRPLLASATSVAQGE